MTELVDDFNFFETHLKIRCFQSPTRGPVVDYTRFISTVIHTSESELAFV